ncbi:MAG: OmpA family protein [Flexibacteraceae bacterium]
MNKKLSLIVCGILISVSLCCAQGSNSLTNSKSVETNSELTTEEKPTSVVRFLRKAIVRFHEQDNIAKVIEYCGYLLDKQGFTPEYYYYLGNSYYQAREFILAEANLKQVPKTDKHYGLALLQLAEIQKTFGKYPEAKKYLEQITNSKSDSALLPIKDRAIDGLPFTMQLAKEPATAILYKATQINHPYSDLAAALLDSIHLLHTYIVEDSSVSEEQGKRIFSNTRLSESVLVNDEWADTKDLDGFKSDFNRFVNGNFDAEINTLFLTKITEGDKKGQKFELFTSKLDGQKFRKPRKMSREFNPKKSQNLHPSVSTLKFRGIKTKVLFFTSNRSGGFGGKDIWYSLYNQKTKKWQNPVNAGAYVNTAGNEITPSFDSTLEILYFSSDYHIGLGGYDVFQVKWEETGFYPAKNMGVPINSGYDDHYFTRIPGTREGFLSSNRPNTGAINTCCDDIFQFSIVNLKGEVVMPSKKTEERGYKPVLTLYFQTNDNELSPSQKRSLDSLSFDLLVNSHKTVLVKGHTDDVGSQSYNLTLSEKRAQNVYEYLKGRKVEVHRMLKAAVEMREPAIPYEKLSGDPLENARKYNRRVEIFMISL